MIQAEKVVWFGLVRFGCHRVYSVLRFSLCFVAASIIYRQREKCHCARRRRSYCCCYYAQRMYKRVCMHVQRDDANCAKGKRIKRICILGVHVRRAFICATEVSFAAPLPQGETHIQRDIHKVPLLFVCYASHQHQQYTTHAYMYVRGKNYRWLQMY